MLDTFGYRWRCIELFANEVFDQLSEEEKKEWGVRLELPKLHKTKLRYVPILSRITIALDTFPEKLSSIDLTECSNLRNDIMHGDISPESYEKVVTLIEPVNVIASKIVEDKIDLTTRHQI